MKVHEIMTAHARCVGPDNNLVEAAGLMREMDVGALPVCEEGRILGMLTDRDLAVRAIADGRDPNTTLVGEIMTRGATCVFADDAVEQAARIMEQHEVRRLPVIDRRQRLVGILSLGDMAVSSNPAFAGLTLREVSQPHEMNGRDEKRAALGRAAGGGRMPRVPDQPGATERPPQRRRATGRNGEDGTAARGSSAAAKRGKSRSGAGAGGTGKRAGKAAPRKSAAKSRRAR